MIGLGRAALGKERAPARSPGGALASRGLEMESRNLDRLVRSLSGFAAILLLGVTLLVFISVLLRFFFNSPIPDTNDLGRLTMGIALMNGIALATYYGQQITMDTVWLTVGARAKKAIDIVATAVTFSVILAITWLMFDRVASVIASEEQTFDLGLPLWIFYALVAASACAATFLSVVRLWAVLRGGDIAAPVTDQAID